MRCPYRKQTTTKNGENGGIIYEDFMDCYKEKCPFYYKGKNPCTHEEYEECDKASKEIR